jgi:hypothetical protein
MLRRLLVASLILAAVACGRDEEPGALPAAPPAVAPSPTAPPAASAPVPFRVAAIQLGSAVAADERVASPGSRFEPTDTIYASVETEGCSPGVTLSARWSTEDGKLLDEASETIAPTGPAFTEFHLSKPSGLPAGRYKVEIAANGSPIGTKRFEIR